ncbi:MAG: hypothetical protein C0601_10425 [Candidatus Muiribacterium halophilum]|uniref:SGNH hydrolase-type esterase domain-containing protein n=1 Tax=Muiribacterium halophilum TaxID=2053465 RepID=A0A2N5ZCJ0_MUIH1|nr:MAG: hypothetical protein C0601_10425 [Candidatus Muirbacterium halophilum]
MYRLFPVISAKRELWAIISDEIDVAERKYRVKEKNLYSEENLKNIAKKRAKSHLNRCNIEFLERNLVGLNIIIGRLRQMEAKIIIVIPPFTKYYYNEFSDVYKQIMNDTLMDVSKNHKIIFKDYSEDKRFYENIDLFADSDHLNKSGRKLFTKILFEECIFDR